MSTIEAPAIAASDVTVEPPTNDTVPTQQPHVPGAPQPYMPGAQQPYANAPAPAEAPQGRENAFAITSFVLGIASILSGWTVIAPIIGLVFGVLSLRRKTTERTLALWGVWMNAAILALAVVGLAIFAIVILFTMLAELPLVSM